MMYFNGERVGAVFPVAGSTTATDLVFEYVYDEINNPIATVQSVETRIETYSQTVAAALEGKQDALTFMHSYDPITNPVATLETVVEKVAEALAEFVAGAPNDLNDVKELAEWLLSHETDALAMNASIKNNKSSIENIVRSLQNGSLVAARSNVTEKAACDGNGKNIADTYALKGIGGTIDIEPTDWENGICTKTIRVLNDDSAIFFSPATVESKGYIEDADIFITSSGNTVTFTCLFTTPKELVQFKYFIVRG